MKEMKLGEIPFYYNLQTEYHNPCGILSQELIFKLKITWI